MDIRAAQMLTNEELRQLYREYSEDVWRASWMATNNDTVTAFIRWLASKEYPEPWEPYETDGVRQIRNALNVATTKKFLGVQSERVNDGH